MISHTDDLTNDVHGERDESVVADEEGKEVNSVDDDTELLHEAFAIKEVVRSNEEIPRKRPEPRKIVHFVDSVANVDYLSKALKI